MSAVSPVESAGGGLHNQPAGGSGYGSGESAGTKSPLSMSLGFLKGLTQSKTTRGMQTGFIHGYHPPSNTCALDGQPPKRRGPKPDAKPALTRRQELNRQAQRLVCRTQFFETSLTERVKDAPRTERNLYQSTRGTGDAAERDLHWYCPREECCLE